MPRVLHRHLLNIFPKAQQIRQIWIVANRNYKNIFPRKWICLISCCFSDNLPLLMGGSPALPRDHSQLTCDCKEYFIQTVLNIYLPQLIISIRCCPEIGTRRRRRARRSTNWFLFAPTTAGQPNTVVRVSSCVDEEYLQIIKSHGLLLIQTHSVTILGDDGAEGDEQEGRTGTESEWN